MECPKCRLLSPQGALRCDCGYDFGSRTMQPSYGEGSSPRLASLSARFIGQVLDVLVALAMFLGPVLIFIVLSNGDSILRFLSPMGLLAAALYLLFADGLRNGQRYGKRVVKTAVVDATTGLPCTFGKSFLRNLLLEILGLLDWVFIFGAKRQRLGDKAANTIVIDVS